LAGIALVMPWIVKGLVVLARTRKGRKLLLAAGLGLLDLAQSDQARKLYATARTKVIDPALRQTLTRS
jgi:hypothetical protein